MTKNQLLFVFSFWSVSTLIPKEINFLVQFFELYFKGMSLGRFTFMVFSTSSRFAISFLQAVVVHTPL